MNSSRMAEDQFIVAWIDRGREPKCEPNPAYPDGVDLDVTDGKVPACTVLLAHPAKRCGYYSVTCKLCKFSVVCTTAGRPDDPRSIKLPCDLGTIGVTQ